MNKTKLKWPIWFPYPSSWLRALSLIPFVPIGAYSSILLPIALLIFIGNPPSEGKGFSFLTILLLIVILLLCAFVYALVHHKLIKHAKGWIPTLLSDWKGFYAMVVLNFAIMPLWILTFLFAKNRYYYDYGDIIKKVEIPESVAQITIVLFFLIAASMFQFEFIALDRWLKKREKRLQKRKKREEVNKELEQMKEEVKRKRSEKLAKCKKTTWISKNKKRKKKR